MPPTFKIETLAPRLIHLGWDSLSRIPFGNHLFSRIVGTIVPYTSTIDPQVLELRRGYCKVAMRDHRTVRNHLRSIHAIALVNLCEISTGLCLVYSLDPNTRAILVGFSIDYFKKARGYLVSECTATIPEANSKQDIELIANVHDRAGNLVCRGKATWRIAPQTE